MRGYNNVSLYEGLLDSYEHALRFVPNDYALNVFQNDYIYNDSRMEGVEIDIETAAEIVTDIRLSKQSSKYCTSTLSHQNLRIKSFQFDSGIGCGELPVDTLL